jgi:hypothetical protein
MICFSFCKLISLLTFYKLVVMNPKENLKDDRIQGDYLNAFTGLLPIGILSLDP